MNIEEVVDARKERYDADRAWGLFSNARTITTARGKKFQTWNPGTDGKDSILKHAIGPSGNLRAPAYRIGDEYVIGFSPDFYEQWMNKK